MGEKKIISILIIDGQGGKIGAKLTENIKSEFPNAEITAVGTNSTATTAMLKSGANYAATGENSAAVAARRADIIVGPIGIVIADSMLGEITPKIALAVAKSGAKRILLPINRCDNIIVGVSDLSLNTLVKQVITEISGIIACNEDNL